MLIEKFKDVHMCDVANYNSGIDWFRYVIGSFISRSEKFINIYRDDPYMQTAVKNTKHRILIAKKAMRDCVCDWFIWQIACDTLEHELTEAIDRIREIYNYSLCSGCLIDTALSVYSLKSKRSIVRMLKNHRFRECRKYMQTYIRDI